MKKGNYKIYISKKVLYEQYIKNNLSLKEMSKIYPVSPSTLNNYMRKYNIPIKEAKPRNQKGSNNNNWKGNKVGYAAYHYRVEKVRGKPKYCVQCKTTDENKRYEWSNISGKFNNVNDYKRLCKKCHNNFDKIMDNRDLLGRFKKNNL